MYATTQEARIEANRKLLEEQERQGRRVAPVVRRWLLAEAPAKELGR